jgi:hypothetical protein
VLHCVALYFVVPPQFYPDWGAKYFQQVLLLIRDIANPSSSDPFFPMFRQKVRHKLHGLYLYVYTVLYITPGVECHT